MNRKLLLIGGSVAALALAGWAYTAKAADLGGDCCADLEARVAELEATTARKGNRKVTLTISGHVGHQVLFWDDGGQSDMYIGDGGNIFSRFRLRERGYSMPVIARALGLANHTSVFHGLNRVMERGLVEEAARMDQQTTDQAAWTSKNYAPTSTG